MLFSPDIAAEAPLAVRCAAKGIISLDDSRFIFVAGKRGMFNLPGGGIDYPETALEAFYREFEEELGIDAAELEEVREAFTIEGETTSATGTRKLARWTVHTANLATPPSSWAVPQDSEITAIKPFTAEQCFRSENMSNLAKRAIRSILINPTNV